MAGVWLAAALLMAALAGDYRLSVAVAAGVLAVAAVGVDLTVGSAGLLVFSAPAFMLVGALASALVGRHSGLSPTVATVTGMAAGLAIGFVLAALVGLALRRVSGVGVALLTLFALHLVRGIVRQQDSLGGSLGLSGVPPFELGGFRADTPEAQAAVVMVGLAFVLAVVTRALRSGPGLELRAVRADQQAATACGVAATRRRFEAFVLGSLCATLAGSLYAHTLGYVSADSANLAVLMDLLLMVFLGGIGSVWGAVVGGLLVRMVPELYPGPDRFDVLARGATFLFVLAVAPGGLAAAASALAARIRAGRPGGAGRTPAPMPEPPPPPSSAEPTSATMPEWPPLPSCAEPTSATTPEPGTHRSPAGSRVVEVSGLTRSFGGVRALDSVDLVVGSGERCAVIGSNGAGKTTLFNVLAGTIAADRGRVRLGGADITALPPEQRARLGIARTFQEVRVFPGLTVLEHALLGTRRANEVGVARALFERKDGASLAAARRALELTGLAGLAGTPADALSLGWQRRLELARAVAGEPRLLLLDEPASGLSQTERDELVDVIRRVCDHRAVVVVDHNLDFVRALADRVLVLDSGRPVYDGPAEGAVRTYLEGRRVGP